MKVVVACDSFKGSLLAVQVCTAISNGIHSVDRSIEVLQRPVADGGEGTVDALCKSMHGVKKTIVVHGPLEENVECEYAIIKDTNTAIIEMSSAAGITLIKEDRNPLFTTTYGVGEIIQDAIKEGCRKFIVGIGGSATNDGGVGMLQALGYEFLDDENKPIPLGAIGLKNLKTIHTNKVMKELKECTFLIASDVDNPLCGSKGASAIYGPQKGATPQMIQNMDAWLSNYATISKSINQNADENYPGSGAAGGLGFAFHTFLNAELKSGIEIVLSEMHLEEDIKNCDFVITGEGKIDEQSLMGKVISGIAQLTSKYNKTLIALAGSVSCEEECNQKGIIVFPIVRGVTTLQEAMNPENAKSNLEITTSQIVRLMMK